MPDARDQILFSRSSRDLIVRELAARRPLLSEI